MVVCVTATTDHPEIAVPGVAQTMCGLQKQASQPSRLIGSVWLVPLFAGAWLLGERPLKAEVSAASGAQSLGRQLQQRALHSERRHSGGDQFVSSHGRL